ncbi:hypothetical protein ElyMa_007073200 [Elysia marginata]|uniref:Uncharacterized protein n=1 Tax=Elysia marginata TaxID=1093978 RepID=A0AAV4JW60_9GAST|nr:hypothetical protein ElyMa_007073200 [Elysia marginata]
MVEKKIPSLVDSNPRLIVPSIHTTLSPRLKETSKPTASISQPADLALLTGTVWSREAIITFPDYLWKFQTGRLNQNTQQLQTRFWPITTG